MMNLVASEISRIHLEELRREAAEHRLAKAVRAARKEQARRGHPARKSRGLWQLRRAPDAQL